jgi:hypothetical protein
MKFVITCNDINQNVLERPPESATVEIRLADYLEGSDKINFISVIENELTQAFTNIFNNTVAVKLFSDSNIQHLKDSTEVNSYKVSINKNNQVLICGVVSKIGIKGWIFTPAFQAGPSRRYWDSPEEAIGKRVKDYTLIPNTAGDKI